MSIQKILNFPSRVEIELSSACNLRCTYCPRHYLPPMGQMFDADLFKRLIDEITPYPQTILTLHRRGESLLHPRINDLMNMVAGRFEEVQMATNGTLLTKEKFPALVNGLTFISFSIDVPETFNATRLGADYTAVERNIFDFLAFNKGQVRTQVSMVRTDTTPQEHCEKFAAIWKDKVDRVRVYEEHSKNGVFGALANGREERKPCTMPFYEILVYADGTVGRCNHDWNGPRLGDLNTQGIRDIWHGDALNNLRQQHAALVFTDPVCSSCDSWYPEPGVQGTGTVLEE